MDALHAAGDPARLAAEVTRLRRLEPRPVFDTRVQVGVPAGPRVWHTVRAADLPAVDAALRTDLVGRLLEQAPAGHDTVWLWRPGFPAVHDLDLAWLSAAIGALAVVGRPLRGFFAVTPHGWLDVRTGTGHPVD